jgi:membrane protein implicated in regulation of membrane protease activity
MIWALWWAWALGALVLGALELLIAGYIFLGFAIGAAGVAALLGIGGPLASVLASSLPATLVVFAVLALVSWFCLRRLLGVQKGQTRIWTRDINDG